MYWHKKFNVNKVVNATIGIRRAKLYQNNEIAKCFSMNFQGMRGKAIDFCAQGYRVLSTSLKTLWKKAIDLRKKG
jgi:hypothetical protein